MENVSRYEVRRICLDEAQTYLAKRKKLYETSYWDDDAHTLVEYHYLPHGSRPMSSRKGSLTRDEETKAFHRRRAVNRREHEHRAMGRLKWKSRLGPRWRRRAFRNGHDAILDNQMH
jgi:hypothetical protein